MSKKKLININPEILKWARTESGISVEDVSYELKIDTAEYLRWEKDGKNIPFVSLKKISKIFRRQIACFFLSVVPARVKKPKDHRNLKNHPSKLSQSTLLAIRRTNRYRELLCEFNSEAYYKKAYSWFTEFNSISGDKRKINNENSAKWIRDKINFTLDVQLSSRNPYELYKKLRELIELHLSVPVFQFKMPIDEVQGFSYSEGVPFCITVNNMHFSETGRLFTLAHELGHILLQQSSLCFLEDLDKKQSHEFACNSFAGKLLIPTEFVEKTTTVDDIYRRAKRIKVSSEAYLRRLKELNLLTDKDFFTLLVEIRSRTIVRKNKFIPHLNPLQKSINSRGVHLFNTVINASQSQKISYAEASDILGMKTYHFVEL